MSSWRFVAGWVVALVVTSTLTWQITSTVDDQVRARPITVVPSVPQTPTDNSSQSSTTSTVELNRSTTSTSPATVPESSTPSSPTSTSSSTTTTTTVEWSVRSISTEGGVVVVRYRPGQVELVATTPLPGFDVEITDSGPQRVRVEFENDDTDVRVDAEWKDGGLEVEVTGED